MIKSDMTNGLLSAFIITLLMSFINPVEDGFASDVMSRKDEMVSDALKTISSITGDELATEMKSGSDIHIIDIRTPQEFDQGHVRGAVWIPGGMLEFDAAKGKLPPVNSIIIIYCKMNGRSALAAKTLMDLGFTDVVSLGEGFKAWVEAGRSVYNMHGELIVKSFEQSEVME